MFLVGTHPSVPVRRAGHWCGPIESCARNVAGVFAFFCKQVVHAWRRACCTNVLVRDGVVATVSVRLVVGQMSFACLTGGQVQDGNPEFHAQMEAVVCLCKLPMVI